MNKINMLCRMVFTVVTLILCFQIAGLLSAASKKTIEKLAVECQAGEVESCEKLAKIAMRDSISCNLVDHITDQATLVKLAIAAKDMCVRCCAVKKVTEQKVLAKVAFEDKELVVRITAVERLTDEALLARVAVEDQKWIVRNFAGKRLGAQTQSSPLMSVQGTATDDQNQTTIKGLKITLCRIENEKATDIIEAQTDDKGFFNIRFMKAGTYEFMLDIPGVGIVFIPDSTETETSEENGNRFEIEDGKNLNLNFKVGPREYPDKIIETLKDKNQVNITFHYGKMEPENSSVKTSKKEN